MNRKKEKRQTLWKLLAAVPDHREARGRRYPLRALLAIAIGATLAGRRSLASIARWGRSLKKSALRSFGIRRKQAPCHATWHYVFKGLDVKSLEDVLAAWVLALKGDKKVGHVAIDGKRLRGSRSGEEYPGTHLLSAYCEEIKGVLGQQKAAGDENEITAALRLLKDIPLEGAVVTGDAIFTQKEICREITERGGDYFFVVKDNQAQLKEDIETVFSEPVSPLRRTAS